MDTDEEPIVGPNGLQLIDVEIDVLRNEFAEWQERNPGESMPLADYAAKFFFAADCSPDVVDEEDCNNAVGKGLYPDLSKSTLGPAPVIMSADADRPLPVLNRASASGLPVLERIAGDAAAGRQSSRTLPVLERISKGSPTMIGNTYNVDKNTLREWPNVEDRATSWEPDDVFSLLKKFHGLPDAAIEYKVILNTADSNRASSIHMLTDDFYIEYEAMDLRIILHLGDEKTSFGVQGTSSKAISLYNKLVRAGEFSKDNDDAKPLLALLEKISGYLEPGATYDSYDEDWNIDGSVEYTLRTKGSGTHSMVGMPTLERISAKSAMPALERIPTNAAMPALERISRSAFADRSRLPTLERIDDNDHGVISSASLRAMEASVRSHGTFGASIPAAPARKRTNTVLGANRAYEDLFDDSSDSEDFDDAAVGLDTSTRAALVHSFSTVRDAFAKNKISLASEVGASRGGLLSFAAELRDALAAVDARDAIRASRVQSRHLSQDALAVIARAHESDSRRAAFVASAETLSDLIVDYHGSDAEIREVLVGLKKPASFIGTMYEAWKRLVNQAVKDARNTANTDIAYDSMSRVFEDVSKRVTLVERKKTSLTRPRMIVWGYIAGTIVNRSTTKLVQKDKSTPWSQKLWRRMIEFRGVAGEPVDAEGGEEEEEEEEEAPTIGNIRILAETKIAGKVYRGLKIVADKAIKGSSDDQLMELAVSGTENFMTKYFDKERTRVSCFMSAVAGIELMAKVATVRGYDDVYNRVVVEELRFAVQTASADTDV